MLSTFNQQKREFRGVQEILMLFPAANKDLSAILILQGAERRTLEFPEGIGYTETGGFRQNHEKQR